ncbi:hypothetical protein EPH_0004570 [Eimeria praecox]|uniref:Integrase catalytic domain-containing protein n=1 Tax=Eimeria praecox TaxID=51316 RepID=U6G4Q7_9EIME|nr:hypothetical protein EPH_0004570 [Eimeria praecox]
MAHFIRTKKRLADSDTVELLVDYLVCYHGLPHVFIWKSDRRFQSDVWQQLCIRFSITLAMPYAYYPENDGRKERTIQALEQTLRTCIQYDEHDWEHPLVALALAYNMTCPSSTKLSSFRDVIG